MTNEPPEGNQTLRSMGLGDLLVDPVVREQILLVGPLLDPVGQVRRHGVDVLVDRLPGGLTGDDQLGEVLVEDVADDPDREVGLTVQQGWGVGLLALGLDLIPHSRQARHVRAELVLAGPLGCRTHDDAGVLRDDIAQDLLQAGAFGVRELA